MFSNFIPHYKVPKLLWEITDSFFFFFGRGCSRWALGSFGAREQGYFENLTELWQKDTRASFECPHCTHENLSIKKNNNCYGSKYDEPMKIHEITCYFKKKKKAEKTHIIWDYYFFFFFGHTCSIWKFPSQGWNLSHICHLHHSRSLHHSHSNEASEQCLQPTPHSSAISLTHSARPGIEWHPYAS